MKPLLSIVRVLSFLLCSAALTAPARPYWAFIGTYTGKGSEGIYSAPYDSGTGRLGPLQLAATLSNPSFLAVRPGESSLLSASDIGTNGAVVAFRVDRHTGTLRQINKHLLQTRGICHVSFDATGRFAFAASYGSGKLFSLRIQPDGSVGEDVTIYQARGHGVNPARQNVPHAHQVVPSPDNRFVFACDLGLDTVDRFQLDAKTGALTAVPPFATVAPGAGARHLAFSPDGRFAFVVGEMASTVTTFAYSAGAGGLTPLSAASILPPGFVADPTNTGAELAVHPSGKFLYASDRGPDVITVFAVDSGTGRLTPASHVSTQGKTPRFFTLDPEGTHLLVGNQNSASLVGFTINPADGSLTPTGQMVVLNSPVCVVFVPAE